MSSKAVKAAARTTIAVHGARVHNLKNIIVEIPRDKLIVVTGLSGSGKSSLAFDTIYAEGQRRYMESLSTYAKRFVAQVAKPDVDFVYGLSPVISIEQKTIANNPRSTVGTMTDIASYLNLLYATIGEPHCPRTGELTPSRTASQILEAILGLPEGTEIELRAPVFKQYGEELDFVLTEVRKKGCRIADHRRQAGGHLRGGGDRRIEGQGHGRGGGPLRGGPQAREGDQGRDRRHAAGGRRPAPGADRQRRGQGGGRAVLSRACSKTHHFVYGDIQPEYFMFNNPESACRTCGGLGVHKLTHPELLVPDPRRSIVGGCFVREAFKYNPGHLGRARDVQPLQSARLLARHAVGEAAGHGAARHPGRPGASEDRDARAAGGEGQARGRRAASRSASAASRAASSGTTAATGSAARPAPAWKRGSTR